MVARSGAWLALSAILALACGHATRPRSHAAAGSQGQAGGGAVPSVGGAPNGGAPAPQGGKSATAGSESSNGGAEAGETGAGGIADAGEAAVNQDFTWALWPMPNAKNSGLPRPASYDTSTPGVVIDNVTGLTWQAEPAPFTVPSSEPSKVCAGLDLGGYDDWRVPSRLELVSLMSYEAESIVDTSAFPLAPYPSWTWSSSTYADQPTSFWIISGFKAFPSTPSADESFAVRCVRSDPQPPPSTPHYAIEPDVVKDNWTGLWWERTPPAAWDPFDQVNAHCDDLELGGFDDWYLPSLKEMLSLIDEHQDWPALDMAAFPAPETVASGWFWSSTHFPPLENQSPHVASIRFADGYTDYQTLPGGWLARCARQEP